ncbi:hypothetical protein CCHR01_15093 [Colletotrichum chrysophilum]|uniref:Xylanolytic transcriptional activator regulatory domain-containing protein n=1 Tax=Colletotrichum chrysophilum TaxID=1836956 RepID=A0AAD9EBA2_9PEZI|nr:hypothetical protein CCHR01_15093 [Colletotrichum chrysophilum]
MLKESPPSSFPILRSLMPVPAYIELCRDVYFSIDEYADTDFIIANSGLYYLFTEHFCPTDNEDLRKQYFVWGRLCRDAMMQAVGSLTVCLPAHIKSVQALVLGASHAIELAKPWLAWRLISFAAQLAIAAGFHEDAFMESDDVKIKKAKMLLFWYVYAVEKGLALRLGRASIIRVCDITLPKDMSCLSLSRPWKSMLPFWVWNATMHDKLYEALYSRAAATCCDEDIVLAADRLLAELKEVEPYDKVREDCIFGNNTGKLERLENVLAVSQKALYYTTATLISRAKVMRTTPPTLSPQCLEYARAAIHAHHECMSILNGDRHIMNIYIHWRVLHVPFVPVLVLYCNVVSQGDSDDLQRLQEFAKGLEVTANLSASAKEFCERSKELHRSAISQFEAVNRGSFTQEQSIFSNGLHQYFAGNVFPAVEDEYGTADISGERIQTMFGGQHMMGLF